MLVPRTHYYEDVDIAIGAGPAISMRAEQDDLVWLKALRHVPREAANDAHGHVRAPIQALRVVEFLVFAGHICLLYHET
jgi:hypothetical protein